MTDYTPQVPDDQGLSPDDKRELKKIAHKAASDLTQAELYFLAGEMLEMAMDLDPKLNWGDGE